MLDDQSTPWSEQIEATYKTQARELWAIFYAQCSDPERAMDAVQESFTRLQNYHGEPIREMRKWLLRVGTNWLRDCARRKVNSVRQSDHLEAVVGSPDDSAHSNLVKQELHGEIREALRILRLEDRTVLILRYALNWSSLQMGRALEVTPQAIDMRLSRARKRLAEVFEQMGISHEEA